MTATATPPRADAAQPPSAPTASNGTGGGARQRPLTNPDMRWVWIAAEIALVATSLASMMFLVRVFSDTTFVGPVTFSLLVGHAVLIGMRWFGFRSAATVLMSLVATIVAIVAIHYSDTAIAAVIPTSDTIAALRNDLTQAQSIFQNNQAPVLPVTGFLVVASAGAWLLSVLADWSAFRLFSPTQALMPFLTVMVFVSLLGTDERRLQTTATALVCGVLFLLAHRAAARAAQGVWLEQGPARGYTSLMVAGGVVAAIAAVAGILGGPAVPGANEEPLVELGGGSRDQNKPLEVISPLVQIQPRLVDQSDQVLFTVETNQRAYWRIAALDVFDGALWRSQGQFRAADDALPVSYPSATDITTITSQFDLGQLNVVWAPAAYLPTRFENLSGSGVNYEAESATFIVDTNDQTVSDGLRYVVESQIANHTADSLRSLGATRSDTVDPRYLELPSDYSPLARETAAALTAGLTSPYDQALALQNYFRDNFTYDLDVAKGHDIRRLEDFLTVQRGYCEQFAGTYASMARSIGLPARVATGFTPGDPDPDNPNRYLVRGKHAHAWPEVYIAGAGWVAFEPTPGRGAPNASDYTGVPEAQDSVDEQELNNTETEEDASEQAQAAPPTPTPVPPEARPDPIELQPAEPEATAAETPIDTSRSWRNLTLALAGLLAWIVGVPLLKRWKDRRRIARIGTDTRRRITLAWARVADLVDDILERPPIDGETLQEYAARVQKHEPATYPDFGELTELAVQAAYRPTEPDPARADRAEELANNLRAIVMARQPWPVRGAHELDPRPLLQLRDDIGHRADRLAEGALTP